MRQATQNSFNEGLLMDMNPLVTPQTCLSDCLNGTLITFNGNEFTLQSDNGNVKIDKSEIKSGYVPVGAKEYGGILYLALLDPVTGNCEIGSIPSPDFDTSPKDSPSQGALINFQASKDNYSKITRLFERDQLIINPGDNIKITETIGSKPKLYKYNYKVFDSNENMYDLELKETDEFQPFTHRVSATLGLEVILNNITYFDCYAINSNEGLKLYYFAENNLQDEGKEDDIFITKIDVYINNSNEPISINVENNDKWYITGNHLLIPQLDIKDYKDIISLKIIPFSNYEELSHLEKNYTPRK